MNGREEARRSGERVIDEVQSNTKREEAKGQQLEKDKRVYSRS